MKKKKASIDFTLRLETPGRIGGSAFPGQLSEHDMISGGMTLRDWFAGQALAGMVSGGWIPNSEAECATRLYRIADAMLAARAKGGQS